MSRVSVREVKARKPTKCATCGNPIVVGQMKAVVESFRRRVDFCLPDKPTAEQARRYAPQSRSDRASDAAGAWRDAASELDDIASEARELASRLREETPEVAEGNTTADTDPKVANEDLKADVKALADRVANVGVDTSEAESLRDEMQSWEENLSGANMEHLPKYDEVQEANQACEEAVSDAENVTVPSLDATAGADALDTFADECEEAAGSLNEAADALEGVDFPGMY